MTSEFFSLKQWPEDALENSGRCPVCGSESSRTLHEGLMDLAFRCAPGKWTMKACEACGSAYLDPRPTPESIGRAYEHYYTHATGNSASSGRRKGFAWIKRALADGYLNQRFGTDFEPAWRIGGLMAKFMPSKRGMLAALGRGLPRPRPGAQLLDVGCGNGAFLQFARHAGWDVTGVDPDPKAVDECRRSGLNVFSGGIEVFSGESSLFDAITLSHVIEHVYDPNALLESCFKLLRPNGYIWIDTPNIDAQGHRRYGPFWRGLEPPRHLLIFTRNSLMHAIRQAGFIDVRDAPYQPLCAALFAKSEALSFGLNPYEVKVTRLNRLRVIPYEIRAWTRPSVREFLTVMARKSV